MIILDTNVLAALMRTVPEAPVVAWLDRQPAESVWITSITLFEVRLGLALLPSGSAATNAGSGVCASAERGFRKPCVGFRQRRSD